MSVSTSLTETTLAAIESYALALDKPTYFSSLSEGLEKNIITIITQPYASDYRQKLTNAGVPYALIEQIVERKLYDRIQTASSIAQIQQIVNELKKSHLPYFNQTKPLSQNRKNNVNSQVQGGDIEKRLPSKIVQKQSQRVQDYFVNILKQNEGYIQSFSDYAIRNLSHQSILNLKQQNKIFLLSKGVLFATFDAQFVAKFAKTLIQKQKQINSNWEIPQYFWSLLPTTHINKAAELLPNLMQNSTFITVWFANNFTKRYPSLSISNGALSLSEKQEKRKLLIQAIQKIGKLNTNYIQQSMIKQIQLELLNLDLALEDVDLDRYLNYISKASQIFPIFNEEYRRKIQQFGMGRTNQGITRSLLSSIPAPNTLFIEYLKAILLKYEPADYSKFESKVLKYIDERTYNILKAKTILAKGLQLDKSDKSLSENEKIEIRDSKLLTICESNKNTYKVDQDVVLKIKIKNISKVVVKIYELNLEKHYIENKTAIDDNMDLHFLDPTYQFVYQVPYANPFKEEIFDLALKEIKKQRGVYVVDFDGCGISSRAIIRKGAIFCMKRVTLAGLQLKFYDEAGKRIQQLSIWLRGQSIKVKGTHLIPFGEQAQNTQIIAVVGEYAQMLNISIPNESYRLEVSALYNEESFIVGGKAKIILSPRLYLNQSGNQSQTPISLKLLKNIRINVQVQDYQYLKSTISFDNVNWSYKEDYVIQLPIQTYIRNVSINGSAEITKYNGKKEQLSFTEQIALQFNDETGADDCFKDYYLKKEKDNYILHVLGMDGENIANAIVHLDVNYKWVPKPVGYDLESDAKGQINLGSLKLADYISIPQANKSWRIQALTGTVQLAKRLCFKEREQIRVPLPPLNYKLQIGSDINLFFVIQETRLQNMNSLIKVNEGYLEIPALPQGKYILSVFSLNLTVNVTVLKGEQWQNPNQLYDAKISAVYQFIRSSNNFLSLGQAAVTKQKENHKVSLRIIKPQKVEVNDNVKAHVLAYSFIPNKVDNALIVENSQSDIRYEKFVFKGSSYLSNKKLSQQASYVLNRKEQKQFVGNNLQKPHILLNRIKVRDTTQKDEQMQDKSGFKQKKIVQQNAMLDLLDDAPMYANRAMRADMTGAGCLIPICPRIGINSHNNFLRQSGMTIENIKGQVIQFQVPHCYSYVSVVLASNNSKYVRNYNMEESSVESKKVSHSGLAKEEKENQAWSMSRQIYTIGKKESRKMSRTSKWCAVSLLNVIQFAKTQGVYLESWVERWATYSEESKLQVYNKKVCHELNSYLKHQDQPFFNKVVAPYISNKINKTFVDLCLLEDKACEEWVALQYFEQLNAFEKVLLIQYLAKKGKHKEAEQLAQAMELKEKVNKYSYNVFKEKFETMMNAEIKPVAASDPYMPPPPPPMAPMPMAMGGMYYAQPMMATSTFSASSNYNNNNNNFACFGAAPSTAVRPQMMMQQKMVSRARAPVAMDAFNMVPQSMAFSPPQEMQDQGEFLDRRAAYVQQFKEVQSTEQFTQVTYNQIKDPSQCNANFIPQAKFWSDLALHFAKNKNNSNFAQQNFITESLIYLADKRSFTLAISFLPKNLNADYEISAENGNIIVTANQPLLLFVKEIKLTPYLAKNGIMINHRFFDPTDQYSYEEDGTQVQKQVEEFVIGKKYSLQTLATNTTGNNLEVQLLVDIPEGSIPLGTKEYTQISSFSLSPYSTQSFNRQFYFPSVGKYSLYPASISYNKNVIAKAAQEYKLQVKEKRTSKKLQTLMDVIAEGEDEDIIKYLQSKNIFDDQFFKPHQILWMLKDKARFSKIIDILRNRQFIHTEIWRYGFLHDDLRTIQEYLTYTKARKPCTTTTLKVFEYFPYYSSRAHKYQNENKSKIRNVEFKETYYRFLLQELTYYNGKQENGFKLAAAYYLLLQDRVDEASKLVKTLSQQTRNQYKLQFDYLECFLDMYEGFPNFSKARTISQSYVEYPLTNWRTMFEQIQSTLKNYDSAVYVDEDEKKVQYKTTIINEGQNLRISIPAQTRVQVLLYTINLQLLFSDNPFKDVRECCSVKPAKIINYQAGDSREEKLKRPADMKDIIVEVFESGKSTFLRKVDSLFWTNPLLKVKVNQKKGSLQVFYENKPVTSCYCKVYSTGSKGQKFYRDGYTDITGAFKYALSELKEITQFSILCASQHGGLINKIAPPSQAGEFVQM